MKIIHFVSSLGTGGAEVVVKDSVLSLNRLGHEVMVLVYESNENWPYEKQVRENGISVKCVGFEPTNSILKRAFRKLFRRSLIKKKLLSYINEFKPDVIHTHLDLITFVSDIRNKLSGIKLVYTCHSDPEKNFGKKESVAIRDLINSNGIRIIALHNNMAEEIKTMFPGADVTVLENPIDIKRFQDPGLTEPEAKKKLGIPENAYVIGHVGRFVPLKNHKWLIQVFKAISETKPEAFLLMAGENTEQSRKNVTGQLDDLGLSGKYMILQDVSDMPCLYAAMDVFVLPSEYEGFPIALLEAQAAGLKCVVSDAISQEAFLTEKIIPVSLSSSKEVWRDAVIENNYPAYKPTHTLKEYDRDKVIDKLLNIYYC